MQARLRAAGLRPISNVVDVTNYVMLELGQPLHAFDLDTLREGRIVVRRARVRARRSPAIDGTEVALEPEMLVIADAERPVAIAGVMGGLETEVTERTTDLLLESAHFSPASVRRTAKRIPLSTASSYRFERSVDPNGVLHAADRAAQLIVELAGGRVSQTVVDQYPRASSRSRSSFGPSAAAICWAWPCRTGRSEITWIGSGIKSTGGEDGAVAGDGAHLPTGPDDRGGPDRGGGASLRLSGTAGDAAGRGGGRGRRQPAGPIGVATARAASGAGAERGAHQYADRAPPGCSAAVWNNPRHGRSAPPSS